MKNPETLFVLIEIAGKHIFLLLPYIFLDRGWPLWVCTSTPDCAELTKAFPPGRVGLIIILMASQSDANGPNGKARDGGKNGGEEAKPKMEVLKIRFAFWDKNMQALKRTLNTFARACVRTRVCACTPVCSNASARCEREARRLFHRNPPLVCTWNIIMQISAMNELCFCDINDEPSGFQEQCGLKTQTFLENIQVGSDVRQCRGRVKVGMKTDCGNKIQLLALAILAFHKPKQATATLTCLLLVLSKIPKCHFDNTQ